MELDHKISELSTLPDSALSRMIEDKKSHSLEDPEGFFISQLIAAGFTYDEQLFTNVFAQCLARYGVREAYIRVIYPMLQRIGILWNADRITASNEHFITNLLRQKMLTAIDLQPSPSMNTESWLLFLPENEFHDTGLLLAHYLLRLSGRKSVYLGANLPKDALFSAAAAIRPANILFFFVHNQAPEEMQEYLQSLTASIKSTRIYAAGNQLSTQLSPPKRTHFLESVADLQKLLE